MNDVYYYVVFRNIEQTSESKERGTYPPVMSTVVRVRKLSNTGADLGFLEPTLSLKVHNHSPTGFEFGYGGSGPAQLALALLLDASEDAELSSRFYQEFKEAHVGKWKLTRNWIHAQTIKEFIINHMCKKPD